MQNSNINPWYCEWGHWLLFVKNFWMSIWRGHFPIYTNYIYPIYPIYIKRNKNPWFVNECYWLFLWWMFGCSFGWNTFPILLDIMNEDYWLLLWVFECVCVSGENFLSHLKSHILKIFKISDLKKKIYIYNIYVFFFRVTTFVTPPLYRI